MPIQDFLKNNSLGLLNAGIGLIGGRTAEEQASGGLMGLRNGLVNNRTVQYLQKNNPELAQAVQAGAMDASDAFKLHMQQRIAAQKPKNPWMAVGGRLFNTQDESWLSPPNAQGSVKRGMQPIYMQDENGNVVIGQLTEDGQLVQSKTPNELKPLSPYDKSFQTKQGQVEGEAVSNAKITLPAVTAMADQSIKSIDKLLNHPGRETATGLSGTLDPRNYFAGTDATDFNAIRKTVNGQTFLSAYQSLKGAGAITDIEGQKAEQAITNLDTAQSDEQFFKSLSELKTIISAGKQRAEQLARGVPQAGQPQQAAPTGGVNKTSTGVPWKALP